MVAHDVLTYLSAKSVGFPDIQIKITPYTYQDIDLQKYNPYYKLEYREGKTPVAYSDDSMYDESEYYKNFIKYSNPKNGMISGLQVLSLYSAEPDWGMDQNLNLSFLQNLMGGSQGYRHMRYVLFFLVRAGIVAKQTTYFTRLAKIAFTKKDKYWGLRFFARAIHYLEDLLTPVHSKPFPELFLLKNIFRPKKIYTKSFNYHMNFEKLIGYHLWHGNHYLINAIDSSEVRNLKSLKFLYASLKHSKIRTLQKKLFNIMERYWGNIMDDKIYKIKKNEIEGSLFNDKILKLSIDWLSYSSSIVKGYIKNFIIPELQR